jgi:hypothetical protein
VAKGLPHSRYQPMVLFHPTVLSTSISTRLTCSLVSLTGMFRLFGAILQALQGSEYYLGPIFLPVNRFTVSSSMGPEKKNSTPRQQRHIGALGAHRVERRRPTLTRQNGKGNIWSTWSEFSPGGHIGKNSWSISKLPFSLAYSCLPLIPFCPHTVVLSTHFRRHLN